MIDTILPRIYCTLLGTFIVSLSMIFCSNEPTPFAQSPIFRDTVFYPTLNLMPVPASLKLSNGKLRLDKNFALTLASNSDQRLFTAANRFLRRLDGRTGHFFSQAVINKETFSPPDTPILSINASRVGKLELYEDESYTLKITNNTIQLSAPTDIGTLRGLEALLQLLEADSLSYYFPTVEISDQPRFPWRGLMIDAARHFQPVEVIKRNLDATAAVKMNVLHFHLCDNQGWRVESKVYPKLHQLASDGAYYAQQQVKEFIQYAADRGIRVMPEFDVPGHAMAILVAYPNLGSFSGPYELERNAGIFDPVSDPTNEETYRFIEKLFAEQAALFPDAYFHIGGDENNGNHWKNNPTIQAFMKQRGMATTMDLQTYFNNRILQSIQRQGKKMMGREEILSDGLSEEVIIHSWLGKESLYKAASKGYKTLLSNGYYIDLMFPASAHYAADPLPNRSSWSEKEKQCTLTPEQEKLILGGEATMRSELVTAETIDSRIWPRTAAIAERLWSPSTITDIDDMYRRPDFVSFRLEELGLTHSKNRDVILRNLANGADITSLQVPADVVEPYKTYTRNASRGYKTYSPYSLMAEAAIADAPVARKFSALVNHYSSKKSKKLMLELKQWLTLWEGNHETFLALKSNAPVLKELETLFKNLSAVAAIGSASLLKTTTTST